MSGIVYAHRNEDIVNSKPGVQVEKAAVTLEHNIPMAMSKRKVNEITGKENMDLLMDWKKKEFSRLAQHMGMEELEFSKWLLAASSAQREKVLQNYIKNREKKPIS